MRAEFLSSLIGRPWRADARGPDAFDCWHLALEVQRALWGRALPDVVVPQSATWRWMIETIDAHPERHNWHDAPEATAADGALVLMSRTALPAHIGVWLRPERRVIHADQDCGVVCEPVQMLRTSWRKLVFLEHA